MALYHGTTASNAQRILAGGFKRERRGSAFRTIPELTAGYYRAYEAAVEEERRRLAEAGEDADPFDEPDLGWWLEPNEEALTALPGAVYAFKDFKPAYKFARHRARVHKDDGICVFELVGRGAVPDEDWLGCVALVLMDGYCPSPPDEPLPWGKPGFDRWAQALRQLLPRGWWRQASDALDQLSRIEDPGQAVVATVGKAVIRRLGRSRRGRRWLVEGARWSNAVAILGPVRPVRVACWPMPPVVRREDFNSTKEYGDAVARRYFLHDFDSGMFERDARVI